MRGWWIAGVVGLAGCGDPECTALVDGEWTMDGAAFGMEMIGVVTMDAAACSFTLGEWNMQMGSLPTGGTVRGDAVEFDGDEFWQKCSGTVSADGASITGACDDGSDLTMSAGAGSTMGSM